MALSIPETRPILPEALAHSTQEVECCDCQQTQRSRDQEQGQNIVRSGGQGREPATTIHGTRPEPGYWAVLTKSQYMGKKEVVVL